MQITGKRNLYLLAASSFVLLILLMMVSGEKVVNAYSDEQLLAMQSSNVQVHQIELLDGYTKQQKVYGLVESTSAAEVGFELSGSLAKLHVTEGDFVTKGQPLAALDMARIQAQKRQLQATLQRAEADAEFAGLSASRLQELVEAKLDSKQNLDQAKARLKAANAAVVEVQEGRKALNVEVEKSSITAPFDAQITAQLLDPGTVVSAGQAVFSLVANKQLEARFGLPMQSAFGVTTGQQYTLDFKGMPIAGILQSIAKQRNRATRAIDAVFSLQSTDNPYVMPGDIVSLSVDSNVAQLGAWVPMSALANGVRGLWTLYVAQPNAQGNSNEYTVASRIVAVEYVEDERAYVTGAISDGDLLITSGTHRLTPKQTIANVQITENSLGQ